MLYKAQIELSMALAETQSRFASWMDLHHSEMKGEYGYYVKSFWYSTDDKKTLWHFPDRTISYQCLSARLIFLSVMINKTGFDWSYDVKS